MIKYALKCLNAHEFDGWFRNSMDFETQSEQNMIVCPTCHCVRVEKALMAPAIATASNLSGKRGKEESLVKFQEDVRAYMRKARDYVEKNFDAVGKRFPAEARRMHYGETEARGIYGEATSQETRELLEEGIDVVPVPSPPDELAKKKLN